MQLMEPPSEQMLARHTLPKHKKEVENAVKLQSQTLKHTKKCKYVNSRKTNYKLKRYHEGSLLIPNL
ncbi:hypothetical protein X943_003693 [Babesia divergens]|uniref:Uncharacterized protein n=1 Tax=Babesia divergens TaxID=32595 RepID=A0AAD9LI83_BABDI|nr:hypothetical protein X943_003693 [Babesia divergens]